MEAADYEVLRKKLQLRGTSNLIASLIMLVMLSFTSSLIYLSYTQSGIIWFVSQMLLGVSILQWFFLLHDLGHGHFFSNIKVNMFFGHVASFFVMLPFYSWRYTHRHHHLWTGWKDKDPTMTILIPEKIPKAQKFILNFCWKYWIPIFSLSFSLTNFWNIPKMSKLFPDKKGKFVFSIFFVITTHAAVIFLIGWDKYISTWGLGYLAFFVLSDPLLISQHGGVPQHHSQGKAVGQFHFRDQDEFTRSLVFPKWMKKYIFFGFNSHGLHHLYPTLPGYRLSHMDHHSKNEIHWFAWLVEAKKTPAVDLLFSEKIKT